MNIEPLKIKTDSNYNWDDTVYINDFDVNLLEIIKRESRIGANMYYIGYILEPYCLDITINPLYFIITSLFGYIEEIEGSGDRYLVVAKNIHNKKITSSLDMVWGLIENKINPRFTFRHAN